MTGLVTDRGEKLKEFLSKFFGVEEYLLKPMVSDAGMRSYHRVYLKEKTYVLMDCPPDYSSVEYFETISKFLLQNNFSAPEVLFSDYQNGFLLLQDFGNISFKSLLLDSSKGEQDKNRIYHLIVDLLVDLQAIRVPQYLQDFDNHRLINELEVFRDRYIPYAYGRELKPSEWEYFLKIWNNVLSRINIRENCVVLRDYHVENMMYLENMQSIGQIGLLDFQDALKGHIAYDLVSVLEDARIEVDREQALKLIQYFATKKGLDFNKLLVDYHILGAQRNMRILGVFTRKLHRDGNDLYIKYIPRVLKYLEYDLSNPVLFELKEWLLNLR